MFQAAIAAAALNASLGGLLCPGLLARFDGDGVVGRPVRLIESVPDSHRDRPGILAHKIVKVAEVDGDGPPTPLRLPLILWVTGGPFEGLPQAAIAFHGLHYDIIGRGRKGTSFTVTPTEPGVYEVEARWTLRDTGEFLKSPPAVITVRPAAKKP